MSEKSTYNGYSNYETWCVSLWITNEEDLYNYWRERARDNPSELENELEEWATEHSPDVSGFYSDLLTHALGMVEWREVAADLTDT